MKAVVDDRAQWIQFECVKYEYEDVSMEI